MIAGNWTSDIEIPNHCCETCWEADVAARRDQWGVFPPRLFIVCPTCGNKRCPKATYHALDCTGSNEPGQVGSIFEGSV